MSSGIETPESGDKHAYTPKYKPPEFSGFGGSPAAKDEFQSPSFPSEHVEDLNFGQMQKKVITRHRHVDTLCNPDFV